ncbi:NAD(P)/FAD-dependent oxidoreductase [Lichenicola cladoniae]|uniref:NAD(P)/FAD-dependent oxidoreductase n=1 Tax=Lichenicola cladoniae TaxID=1484109 RepID=A0A6M8HEM5_9PROT|nr:NAD(P)/FAD-dependent oxidoreductase [Lichenicola cladoniae]NPD65258.1 NAD(P)/FAD-dependent oxidoreductase [Acetobacteraceae bacterium]QKE88850.1 NAD(P)/FAD-dependent oxidoreductase [Lichenicola cladoniae]
MIATGLDALERQVVRDLRLIGYPNASWVPPRHLDGERIIDVLIVGAGQGGLTVASQLLHERVDNILVIDEAAEGDEGLWLRYARMPTLRTAKTVTGPDLGIPSLTFQAWFEAQQGEIAFERLVKIAKEDWNSYLGWLRRMMAIPVQNNTRFEGVVPAADGLRVTLLENGVIRHVMARKLVLAGGIETSGRWWMPPEIAALPSNVRAHTADPIDFAALAGKRVVVIGAGASAFDNAATALEHRAASVELLCRRPVIQRTQPFKIISTPGFLRHFGTLDDATRWRMMRHLLTVREALTLETWNRATVHPNFSVRTGAPVLAASSHNGVVHITIPGETIEADFVICGTGLEIDLMQRPELAEVAPHVALWRDRFQPSAEERDDRLGFYPYLGPGLQFQERTPGAAPWIADIHCFNFGATMSMGPSGSSISAMKFAVPRLVHAMTNDLFRADFPAQETSIRAYDIPEFPLLFARDQPKPDADTTRS